MHQAMKLLDAKAAACKAVGEAQKMPAWHMAKVENQREVIQEAQKELKTGHFASLMDICHLKNAELEPQFQKIQRSSRAPR